VELIRTLARRLNTQFGNVLKVPKLQLRSETARILALDNPLKKMSKSAASSLNYIAMDDDPTTIMQKFKKAVTDSGRTIVFDTKRPGLYNLLTIYQAFTGESKSAIEAQFRGSGYAALKQEVARVVIAALEPIQERYHTLLDRRSELEQILDAGTKHAHAIARATLERVFRVVGLG
jgi:tryptophanyl-tRNA synthetase